MKTSLTVLVTVACLVSAMSAFSQETSKPTHSNGQIYADVIDIAPWGRMGANGRPAGVYADIFKRLSSISGCPMEQRLTPIPRAVAEVTRGNSHITMMLDRADLNTGAIELGEVTRLRIEVWLPKGSKLRTLNDLAGKTVGMLRGPVYHEAFDRDARILKYQVTSPLNQLEMLEKGRLDAAIGVHENFLAAASAMHANTDRFAPPIVLEPRIVKLWVAPAMRESSCAIRLAKALDDMRRSGEVERLVAQAIRPSPGYASPAK